jgi:hypothetical protein
MAFRERCWSSFGKLVMSGMLLFLLPSICHAQWKPEVAYLMYFAIFIIIAIGTAWILLFLRAIQVCLRRPHWPIWKRTFVLVLSLLWPLLLIALSD